MLFKTNLHLFKNLPPQHIKTLTKTIISIINDMKNKSDENGKNNNMYK